MAQKSFFGKLLSALLGRRSPETTPIQAPECTACNGLDPPPYREPPFTYDGIKASDTPQWLWSEAECQAWIIAFCVTSFNMSICEAERAAKWYEGSGACIYGLDDDSWRTLVPGDRGTSLCNFLMSRRNEKGAVPKDVIFRHFERK